MKIKELLFAIEKIAENKGFSKPYIVGGLARDKALNQIDKIDDIDITTGDRGSLDLARHLAVKIGDQADYMELPDGHSSIGIGDLKLDFSSNFKIPGIDKILIKSGIDKPSEMQKELYSRDFTCNASLMTLDLTKIVDPTGLAIEDIKEKMIRTCLSPTITLGYDPKRIIRAVYLSAKLDFDLDPTIISWVKKNKNLMVQIGRDYLVKKLTKAFEHNPERAVYAIEALDIWEYMPAIPEIAPYLVKRRL